MGLSRQEYWSGLPFPSPGDLPNPRIEPRSPALQADSLPSEPPRKPRGWVRRADLELGALRACHVKQNEMGAGLRSGLAPGEAWGSLGQGNTLGSAPGPPSRETSFLRLPRPPIK